MQKFSESHLRTILKTLSVRVCFTLSNGLNAYLLTGQTSVALQIMTISVLINMILFWAHERTWNWVQWNRTPKDSFLFKDGHPRTVSKSLTWRALITFNNFMIPFITTGSWQTAAAFLGLATIMNAVVYYVHERVWNRISWGKQLS